MVETLRPGDIQRLQRVFAHTRDESFFSYFRNLLRARLRFDTFLILRFNLNGAPQALDTWLGDAALQLNYPSSYLEGAYRLDPFFQVRKNAGQGAMYRLSEIAPDRFFSGEYYLQYYEKTKIRDEIGLLVDLKDGSTGHLSCSRKGAHGRFSRKELQCLRDFSPVLLELLRQYCEFRQDQQGGMTQSPHSRPLEDVIQGHVKEHQGSNLTRREAQITALILQGHSNLSAALALGIARQTAKVHRRNIYRKLTISSQAELFAMLSDLF